MPERSLSRYRVSHLHSCGHPDDCFLQRDVAEAEPCRECRAAAFNRKQAEQARTSFDHQKPAVSGEVLQRSRAIDPPKVKTVTGPTSEMTCSGSGAAPASSSIVLRVGDAAGLAW